MPVLPTLFRGGAVPPTGAGSATATPSPRFAPRAPTRSSSTCRPSNSGAACQTGLATDLRTGNAVRFGNRNSSCSAYGIITEPVTVAEAVAASAAFPLLLPAMERTYAFTRPGAAATIQHVLLLTDGGIYDNLGLSVLEPGRSANHTAHVYDVDYIIACDAGRGTLPPVAGHFAGTRLRRSFDIVHRRAQDAARARLHAAAAAGQLQGVVHAYLGMPDERVPIPMADLVPGAAVRHYPTDFKALTAADMQLITTRGRTADPRASCALLPGTQPEPLKPEAEPSFTQTNTRLTVRDSLDANEISSIGRCG